MHLRSGKVKGSEGTRGAGGATWPFSLARELSISTDDPECFACFCREQFLQSGGTIDTNRLITLVICESLYRCGVPVIKHFYPLMEAMYYKMQGSECPRDYLDRFHEFMIRSR